MSQAVMTAEQLLVGGDPEFFLLDNKTGEYVSAHDLLPGSKEKPHRMEIGCVQVDGTAVEFNIDPARSEDEFVANVRGALKCVREMLPQRYEFVFRPSISYKSTYFLKLPKKAVELGCNPDYNAYTFQRNPAPPGDQVGTMRTASGHVTVGWLDKQISEEEAGGYEHVHTCGRLARNLDITLGLTSLDWDRDRTRRLLYGQAGAFRPKPFGIEYRVLSCMWLNRDEYIRQVYRGAIEGTLDFFNNGVECQFMQARQEDTTTRINTAR